MTRKQRTRGGRTLVAACLLIALLAALLGGWFVSGWQDVRVRQQALREAPVLGAATRAREAARELRADLDALVARESQRPYFHYQNLMHDPRTSGLNVSPSPLSTGRTDDLVLGYFQIDAKGRTTVPTINEEVPELSDTKEVAANRRFRDSVARDLSASLKPVDTTSRAEQPPAQVVTIDPRAYAQNANPNLVYSQQQGLVLPPRVVDTPRLVTIVVSPFEWRTSILGDAPMLFAVRSVQTPDGPLTQGFVVSGLTQKLRSKAGLSQLRAAVVRSEDSAATVAPHWAVDIQPDADSLAQANESADAEARGFLRRFAGVSVVAILVAGAVLLVVWRAESLARERSHFAAAAAHELRTPLAGLQLYGDMLTEGLGDPAKVRDYARHMSEDAARLGRVVSNMLGFSQLERGHLSVAPLTGATDEAVKEIVERAAPALARAGVAVTVDLQAGLVARFDRDALTRIMGNLLDNSEKYSRGTAHRAVHISAAVSGASVVITVSDNGPGIGDPARLFRPFSRGAKDSDGTAGLGLGLALSRSLARAMGGDLTAEPSNGIGATLVLRLPRA